MLIDDVSHPGVDRVWQLIFTIKAGDIGIPWKSPASFYFRIFVHTFAIYSGIKSDTEHLRELHEVETFRNPQISGDIFFLIKESDMPLSPQEVGHGWATLYHHFGADPSPTNMFGAVYHAPLGSLSPAHEFGGTLAVIGNKSITGTPMAHGPIGKV